MSAELIDLRTKIDELTKATLDVEAAEQGIELSELVRAILHDYSVQKVRKAMLLCNSLESKGLIKDKQGRPGQKQISDNVTKGEA